MDTLDVNLILTAMRALENAPEAPERLSYFATRAEMNNPGWVAWFKRNHPCVELIEVRPLAVPRGL